RRLREAPLRELAYGNALGPIAVLRVEIHPGIRRDRISTGIGRVGNRLRQLLRQCNPALAAPLRGPRAAAAILSGAASPGSAARISRQPARPRSILVENRNGRSNRAGRRDVSPELRKGSTRDDAVIDAHREIIGRVASSALCEKGNAPRAIIGGSGV